MAGALASGVVDGVLLKLGSVLFETIGQNGFFNLKGGIKDMKSKLSTIQAVLADAEEKSLKDKPLCIWLKKLKDVAYDIDDLLDEFQTESTLPRLRLTKRMKIATQRFFSLSNPIIFRVIMSHKIQALKERLDEIATERTQFHLSENGSSNGQIVVENRETISMVDESKTIGRRDDKEAIMRLVLDTTCEEDISVIPIVGMGGLGKTTLAQLVFHDKRTNEEVFDPRIWVSVCNNFKLRTIVSPILAASKEKCDLNNLETIADFLKRTFTGKKYFLVLDDVWDENQEEWERLKLLLKDGKKGSKIIVTTRSRKVAMLMRTVPPYFLKGLSKDHCWEVFKQRAFEKREDEEYPGLVRIGKEIMTKCGGVPLAAHALGGMLRFKRDEESWNAIKDSETWQLENEDKILPSLMLSFNQLPHDLKQCFAYCSIFPKNFEIEKEKLIQQWVALGFIESQAWRTREDKGSEYFDHLYWMSFLQDLEDSKSVKYGIKYVLHHLVHDLAQHVSGEEVRIISQSTTNGQGIPSHFPSCRYVSLDVESKGDNNNIIFNSSNTNNNNTIGVPHSLSKNVRALHLRSPPLCLENICRAKFLRVLDLHGSEIKEIPKFIRKFRYLRYFDVSSSYIHTLPKSIQKMKNLETLHLSHCLNLSVLPSSIGRLSSLKNLNLAACNFFTLPQSLGNLVNLRNLDLSFCHNLKQLPNSFSALKKLHSLSLQCCDNLPILPQSICSLQNLHVLNLSQCGLLRNLPQSFGDLSNLHSLNLSQCNGLEKLPGSIGILGKLQRLDMSHCSHLLVLPESIDGLRSLQSLNLSYISSATILPQSIGSLENLQELNLSWNFELKTLPSCIERLYNLKTLILFHCWNLQMLPNSITHLTNLETLNLVGCQELTELPREMVSLKNLRSLINAQCQSLRGLPFGFSQLTNLETLPLFIAGLQETDKYSTIADLETLNLLSGELNIDFRAHSKNIVEDARNARLDSKRKLQSLTLTWSDNNNNSDIILPKEEEEMENLLQVLVPPQTLEILYINGYVGGIFSSWMGKEFLPNLVSLSLSNIPNCVSLPSLGYLPSLHSLELRNMDKLQNMGTDPINDKEKNGNENEISLYPSLKECHLINLPNLETWQTMVNNTNSKKRPKALIMFPNLKLVIATKCPKIKPNPCLPPSISDLMVSDSSEILCSNGLGTHEIYPQSLLRRLWIINSRVFSNCWSVLAYQEKLEELTIENCGELRNLPESMQYLTSIRRLRIDGCVNLERIPEWIGKLATLESFEIFSCPNLDCLPLSMQCLTALEEITISHCSFKLEESCQNEKGKDWFKICHVPNISISSKNSTEAVAGIEVKNKI
ncbi:hypothetical protein LUZ60_004041 [Juncus effusus]|nr:hypothetical protein LUZ60_004041 [Juncus effusus]